MSAMWEKLTIITITANIILLIQNSLKYCDNFKPISIFSNFIEYVETIFEM